MGNKSSAIGDESMDLKGEDGSFTSTFANLDADGSGAIDKEEFVAAASSLGLEIPPDEVDETFARFDKDNSNSIEQEEFVQFCLEHAARFGNEDASAIAELTDEELEDMRPYLGPREAARGFVKAHTLLQRNPAAAGKKFDRNWMPIHYLIQLEPNNKNTKSSKAKSAGNLLLIKATLSLLEKIIELAPDCVQARVLENPNGCPMGYLPLYLALKKCWPIDVIRVLITAYPEGMRIIDPSKIPKKGIPKPSLKAGIWARKIAENTERCPPEVLELLPKPKKKKGGFDWLLVTKEDAEKAAAKAAAKAKANKKK